MLLVAATFSLPATATESPAAFSAGLEWLEQPIADTFRELVQQAGIELTVEEAADIEELANLLEPGLEELRKTYTGTTNSFDIADLGIEGCSGNGACGGKYVVNNTYATYFQSGNHAETNVCNDSTQVNIIIGDGNTLCDGHVEYKFCAAGKCTFPGPHYQASGPQSQAPGGYETSRSGVNAGVYIGLVQGVYAEP